MALHGHVGPTAALTAHERAQQHVGGVRALALRSIGAFEAPSIRGSVGPLKAAAVLAAAGAFTLSWERFGNLAAGSYNVKLPVVLFGLALVLGAPTWARRLVSTVRRRSLASAIVLLAVVVVASFVVRALFVSPLSTGLAQAASVLTGAGGPALVALGIVRTRDDARWFLAWIVRGAYFAGAFGLWQLFAFYTGLPQIVVYTGVGTSGVGGRIAAFSYEPAYFAYFIVLAVGAALTVARLDGRSLPWRSFAFFGLVLALANVRALLFLLPVAAVLLAVDWRRNRRPLLRAVLAGAPVAVAVAFAPVLVQSIVAAAEAQGPSEHALAAPTASQDRDRDDAGDAPKEHDAGRSPQPTESSRIAAVPTVPQAPAAVLDPTEQSSNAPRLAVYRATWDVDVRHLAFGVGPGGLRQALAGNHPVATQGGMVVANNIWLQAVADGGVPLLLLEVAALGALGVAFWRSRRHFEQPLLVTLLAVVLVGGMLTSYFFDIKLWTLGAAAAAIGLLRLPNGDAGAEATA